MTLLTCLKTYSWKKLLASNKPKAETSINFFLASLVVHLLSWGKQFDIYIALSSSCFAGTPEEERSIHLVLPLSIQLKLVIDIPSTAHLYRWDETHLISKGWMTPERIISWLRDLRQWPHLKKTLHFPCLFLPSLPSMIIKWKSLYMQEI